MKQTTRYSTFETNSSSTHTLCLVSKEELEDFRNGLLFFSPNSEKPFASKEDIMNSRTFLEECPEAENASTDLKEHLYREFMENFSNTDYAYYYSHYAVDYITEDCLDTNGNPKVAISFYVGG